MSRLTIDITDQQHKSLKALAALEGKTIKQYAIEKLFDFPTKHDEAWQDLKKLVRQRIADGIDGTSGKSIDTIVDEELARGDRG